MTTTKNAQALVAAWSNEHAVRLDPDRYEPMPADTHRLAAIDALLDNVQVVFLGELNHFVHEKAAFRLWWLRRLARRARLVVVEELGWSDGRDVARYLADGDESHLDQLATFGDRHHVRADRDDQPSGVLRASFDAYPTALFKAEQSRFYRSLRELDPSRFYGIDIDAPGTGYADIDAARDDTNVADIDASFWTRLARVPGESLTEEADRLTGLGALLPEEGPVADGIRADLDAMIETLRYTALAHPAADYEALRPAMAYRETAMKRRIDGILHTLANDEVLVLMGHAFHLAKNDHTIGRAGVGPGGGQVRSLGHHIVQQLSFDVASIWMLYGAGYDSQPFPDLPQRANYPATSLNAQLSKHAVPLVVPVGPGADTALADDVEIGHMYNLVVPVHLPSQADAIFFLPTVSPLQP